MKAIVGYWSLRGALNGVEAHALGCVARKEVPFTSLTPGSTALPQSDRRGLPFSGSLVLPAWQRMLQVTSAGLDRDFLFVSSRQVGSLFMIFKGARLWNSHQYPSHFDSAS